MRNQEYLSKLGDVKKYSLGTAMIMAERQIRQGVENGTVTEKDGIVICQPSGKWFLRSDGTYSAMLGAACGDIAGSVYEFHNIKHKLSKEDLIRGNARFTDDTVMTYAVAKGLRMGLRELPDNWMEIPAAEEILFAYLEETMQYFGHRYPNAGYGGKFHRWLSSSEPKPYNSFGNGSAMRASYAGWVARTMAEAEKLGEISAKVTHNHPEGIKGAVVVAGSIFLLRSGATKAEVREYVSRFYDLNFTLDEIRDDYYFIVTCAGSVPQAIVAFLEGEDFVDVISGAISIGGDSDTIAAIAGSLAEVIYPIPADIRGMVISRLDKPMLEEVAESVDFFYRRLPNETA